MSQSGQRNPKSLPVLNQRVNARMIALALWLATVPHAAQANPGDLDPSFGNGGLVTTKTADGQDSALAIIQQDDAKLVVAGRGRDYCSTSAGGCSEHIALARYQLDGSLDTSFGADGIVTTHIQSVAGAQVLAALADGRLLVGGNSATVTVGPNFFGNQLTLQWSEQHAVLVRYNANGTVDTTFGQAGIQYPPFLIWRFLQQSDGKIVAAGSLNSQFALARYDSSGNVDSSFGSGGVVTTPIGSYASAGVGALTQQSDGKLVALGAAGIHGNYDLALVRYNGNGSLDASFGNAGVVTASVGPGAASYASPGFKNDSVGVVLQDRDGKLVVGASHYVEPQAFSQLALLRFESNGTPDTSFGSGGVATNSTIESTAGIVETAEGKLIVVGGHNLDATQTELDYAFALLRFESDGSLDTDFGNAGRAATNFGVGAIATGLLAQSDGKLVAIGDAGVSNGAFGLARFEVDHDSVVLPAHPMTLSVGVNDVSRTASVRLVNGDDRREHHGHRIQLVGEDGDCPPGTVGDIDLDPATPGAQSTASVRGGGYRNARVQLNARRDSLPSDSGDAPLRCHVRLTTQAVGAGSNDQTPRNNVAELELNFARRTLSRRSANGGAYVQSLPPLRATLARGTGVATYVVRPLIVNNNASTAALVHISTADGDCPPGTISADGDAALSIGAGGHGRGLVSVRIDPGQFVTVDERLPARCTATITIAGAAADADPSNDTTQLVIDVVDHNDF